VIVSFPVDENMRPANILSKESYQRARTSV